MTKAAATALATPREGIPIQLQRDKDGQFFDLPKGWKFTNNKVTIRKVDGGLMLTPVKPASSNCPKRTNRRLTTQNKHSTAKNKP